MSFSYENQGTNTYLVYQIEDEEIDSMSLGMITNNQIAGLAPTVFMQMDEVKYIKYNVSAKISVKQFFTGPVNRRRLLGVFNGVVAAMLSAEDYMIDDRMILLDPDYIFADVSTCETVLICLPILKGEQGTDLGSFFKNIMFNTQFDQTENCDYVARIINYLNSVPVFSLAQFKSVLDELNGQAQARSSTPIPAQTVPSAQPHVQIQIPVQGSPSTQPPVRQDLPASVQGKVPTPAVSTPIATGAVAPAPPPVIPQPPVVTRGADIPMKTVAQSPVSTGMPVVPPATKEKNTPGNGNQFDQTQGDSEEKGMSMIYLLRHYNSENAAAYKAQKEAKKAGKPVPSASATSSGKKEKHPGKNKSAAPVSAGFAIPGQTSFSGQPVRPVQQPPVQPVQPVRPVQQPPVQPVQPVRPIQQQPVTPIPSSPLPVTPRPVVSASGANFGETTVLGGGAAAGETTVLNAGASAVRQINPHLVRTKNNEIIPVNKPVFRIGKEKSYVDYFVSDNTAISRSHANIVTREDKYYVIDTNSTNHTFINGTMIPSSTEMEIAHGTKLRFANEDFEFRLY